MWRVSSILRLSNMSKVLPQFTDTIKARGLAVHRANEALALGDGYEPELSVYPHYIEGLERWYRDFAPTVVAVERRIINRDLALTGRIDLAVIVEAVPFIIDVKTGAAAPWHALQTGGYRALARTDAELCRMLNGLIVQRGIIYLPGNGKYKWVTHTDDNDEYLFLSALELIKWKHRNGLLNETDDESPEDDAVHQEVAVE